MPHNNPSKLVYIETKELFDEIHASYPFPDTCLVFIEDTLELWTHGLFFGGVSGVQQHLIWKQNTSEQEGYVLKSDGLEEAYWGTDSDGEPAWIQFGVWGLKNGGTGKTDVEWATQLNYENFNDLLVANKDAAGNVTFTTLNTIKPDDGVTKVLSTYTKTVDGVTSSGIEWLNSTALSVDHAGTAGTAAGLLHTFTVNGFGFDGTEDINVGVIDMYYGGTSKTTYAAAGSGIKSWFDSSEFSVTAPSYVNKLVTIYGHSDGNAPDDIHFDTTTIPTLTTGEYALVNTADGLSWTDLGVYLQAAAAMVFKGTVNCNNADEILDSSYSAKPLPWTTAEIGWTYIVTDKDFTVNYSGDSHGSYGEVSVGDMIICLVSAVDNGGIAQWSIVQNKITNGITYGGTQDPLDQQLWPLGTGEQVNYVALSCGTNPLQIKYHHDGNNGIFVDHDGWLHGKFYGDTVLPPNAVSYAKWVENSGLITFEAVTTNVGSTVVNLTDSSNTGGLRIILDQLGNLVYSSNALWDSSLSGITTVYEIFELSGNAGSYTATLLNPTSISSMANNATKKVVIACIGTGCGFIGAQGSTFKSYAFTGSYSDMSLTTNLWGEAFASTANKSYNKLKSEAQSKANSNSQIVLTLKKVTGGYNIISKDGLYLNTSLDDNGSAANAGGTVYNPVYIDNEGYTRTTDLYSYNLMRQYTRTVDTSWSADTRNTKLDLIYDTYYLDGVNVAGYGKNLVIQVRNAYKLINDEDTSTISGSILQWSMNSSNTESMTQLLSTTTSDLYYRTQNGSVWNNWIKIPSASDYYTKSEIDDVNYVVSLAITDLLDRVDDLESGEYLPLDGGTMHDSALVTFNDETYKSALNAQTLKFYTNNTVVVDINYASITAPAFYESSDVRKKTNIKAISDSIYEFNWKESGEKSYGFIALYLEETNPELVNTNTDGYKYVNYDAALALTISKLENRIKELERQIEILTK